MKEKLRAAAAKLLPMRGKLLPIFCLTSLYFLVLISPPSVAAVQFRVKVPKLGKRCYYQDVLQHTLMVVSASTGTESDSIGLEVDDGNHKVYQQAGQKKLKTAFTSLRSTDYEICVINNGAYPVLIAVSIKQGPEVKDYSKIAKKEHLDPVVAALRQAEDRLAEYHKNIIYLRSRHAKMRRLTKKTSSRVVLFCVVTVGALLLATAFQFLYLRSFLRSKKII